MLPPSSIEESATPAGRPRSVAEPDIEQSTPRAPVTVPSPTTPTSRDWRRSFARRLWLSDLLVLCAAVFGTQVLWFGWGNAQVAMREDVRINDLSYWLFSVGLIIVWMWALNLVDSRSDRVIGTGNAEYVGIASASIRLFGVVAIVAFLSRIDIARGYLLVALPFGVLALLLERWIWRQWLIAKRSSGEFSARVLLVGSEQSVSRIARDLQRNPSAGYLVVGACVPSGKVAASIPETDIPIMGSVSAVDRAIVAADADTVVVTSTDELPASKVKQISWGLEAGRQHLVIAPSIADVAGPRIHTRPVAGLPLIHVETPRFSRGQRFVKRALDFLTSLIGLIVISPVLLVLAILIRVTSPGPVLFRQTRVGLGGEEFTMLKFRSMVVNAEQLLADLAEKHRDAGNEVLFKMTNDPRVTRVGRMMRKYSLDELPQLFNVLGGSMSLVGPRPPLPNEVEQYAHHVHRRFLVKPGITGAWQVSGRSRLSWEDTVRLDLSYVENWTLLGDLAIVLKTAKAVVAPGATAY